MSNEDDFFYAVRLEKDLATRKPGESALQKAEELGQDAWLPSRTSADGRSEARAWGQGAVGEQEVGRRLDTLPAYWTVLHDIPLGLSGANLDHLVIGRTGIYTINTKCLTGHVWVASRAFLHNGRRTDYLPKARAEAERVERALTRATSIDTRVWPIIALVGARLTLKEHPDGVAVVRCRGITRWLTAGGEALTREEIDALSRAARLPSTWGAGPRGGIIDSPTRNERSDLPSTPLTVSRWQRGGHDRLYVNGTDGESLGYLDRRTGEIRVVDGRDRQRVTRAVREHPLGTVGG